MCDTDSDTTGTRITTNKQTACVYYVRALSEVFPINPYKMVHLVFGDRYIGDIIVLVQEK